MSKYQNLEQLMKAFASATRLEILDYIQQGISNPIDIAEKMGLHRTTIDRHLKILTEAMVIDKVQYINKNKQKTASYILQKKANVLMATVKHISKEK